MFGLVSKKKLLEKDQELIKVRQELVECRESNMRCKKELIDVKNNYDDFWQKSQNDSVASKNNLKQKEKEIQELIRGSVNGDTKQKLEEKEQEISRLKRLVSELNNQTMLHRVEVVDLKKNTNTGPLDIIKDLIPVIDDLERAIKYNYEMNKSKALTDGLNMTLKLFLGVLENYGVIQIDPRGKKFDPNFHEAFDTEKQEGYVEIGTVTRVIQKGYTLNGKLLRVARVTVVK